MCVCVLCLDSGVNFGFTFGSAPTRRVRDAVGPSPAAARVERCVYITNPLMVRPNGSPASAIARQRGFQLPLLIKNVLQTVVWQQAHGHAQLAAGVIETELAAGEGVLGLARANRPRRHVAARRGVTNMMLLQHPFIWWVSQWDGAAALPS